MNITKSPNFNKISNKNLCFSNSNMKIFYCEENLHNYHKIETFEAYATKITVDNQKIRTLTYVQNLDLELLKKAEFPLKLKCHSNGHNYEIQLFNLSIIRSRWERQIDFNFDLFPVQE